MRPDPEVLEDQVVQKIPEDPAVLVALVAPWAQWSSVVQKVLVAQVVAQWEGAL